MRDARITAALGLTALLLIAAVPPVAADHTDGTYPCYQDDVDCSWDRTVEDAFRDRARRDGDAVVDPGPLLQADGGEADGRLVTVRRDVRADGRSWDVLATVDFDCRSVATIRNLSVPGYEDIVEDLPDAPGINTTGSGLDLRLCGNLSAGLVDEDQQVGGGSLEVGTGQTASLSTPFADTAPHLNGSGFAFWSGIVATTSLDVLRLPSGVLVSVALDVDYVAEGDLGWGPGTLRLDLTSSPIHRVIAVQTGCASVTTPGRDPLPSTDLDQCLSHRADHAVAFDVGARQTGEQLREENLDPAWASPKRRCQVATGGSGLCRWVGLAASLHGLAQPRLAHTTMGPARPGSGNATARLVPTCPQGPTAACRDEAVWANLTAPEAIAGRVPTEHRDPRDRVEHGPAQRELVCRDLPAWLEAWRDEEIDRPCRREGSR